MVSKSETILEETEDGGLHCFLLQNGIWLSEIINQFFAQFGIIRTF